MLTYRQLLQKCNRDYLDKILLSKTLEGLQLKNIKKPKEDLLEKAWSTVTNGYGHVINTMISKKGKHPKYAIIVDLIPEEKWTYEGKEEVNPPYISVLYYNTRTKPKSFNKFLGFGLCPWADFVDCDVVISPDAAAYLGSVNFFEKVTAEILWEQTFHGYTEEAITGFMNDIKKRIKDIKSGKIKTKVFNKKEGQKYDIHIPEDLLPLVELPKKKK